MTIFTVIVSAIIIVALFWILYIYSVHRARFLVRQQLGVLPEKKSEDAKRFNALPAYQMADTTKDSKNTKSNTKIESFIGKRKIRRRPTIPSDEKILAIPN